MSFKLLYRIYVHCAYPKYLKLKEKKAHFRNVICLHKNDIKETIMKCCLYITLYLSSTKEKKKEQKLIKKFNFKFILLKSWILLT